MSIWKCPQKWGQNLKKGPWEFKIARVKLNHLVTLERGHLSWFRYPTHDIGTYLGRGAIGVCFRKTIYKNKNSKCPIDAHCHRHCRRDPRTTKISLCDFRNCWGCLHWIVLLFWACKPGGSLRRSSKNMSLCGGLRLVKSKKTRKLKIWRTSMQSFVILGSPLQWWWQRASIRHFVFLFSSKFHS